MDKSFPGSQSSRQAVLLAEELPKFHMMAILDATKKAEDGTQIVLVIVGMTNYHVTKRYWRVTFFSPARLIPLHLCPWAPEAVASFQAFR